MINQFVIMGKFETLLSNAVIVTIMPEKNAVEQTLSVEVSPTIIGKIKEFHIKPGELMGVKGHLAGDNMFPKLVADKITFCTKGGELYE